MSPSCRKGRKRNSPGRLRRLGCCERFEAPLNAMQHHQAVICAQCAEIGCDLMQAFAKLVEGVHVARKFRIFQF